MRNFNDLINTIYSRDSINFQKCDNLSLAITKLIKTILIETTRIKSNFLKGFTNIRKNYFSAVLDNRMKLNEQIESFKKQGYQLIFSKILKTQSRLIIGLGSSHVLETSITLHHIYGIPYIPASALKGVCRMVAFWNIAEKRNILNNEKTLEELQKKFYGELSQDEDILKYQLLFGAQNFKGLLLFLDAYPVLKDNQQIFDLDIMNVHYQSYYGDETGKTPPGDWENPVPIIFLTLKEGIDFNFNILFDEFRVNGILNLKDKEFEELEIPKNVKGILENWKNDFSKLKEEIKNLLEKALKEFGIGAKTRSGYGIFE